MALSSRIESDIYVAGNLSARTFSPPAGSITNAAVVAAAGVEAEKLEHLHRIHYGQPNTTATAETRTVYVCHGATGTIVAVKAGSIAAATGNATMTVDVRKNGSSVLSPVITLDNANTARVVEAGNVNVPGLVAGDVLEVVTTVAAGTGVLGTGLFATLTIHEDAQ